MSGLTITETDRINVDETETVINIVESGARGPAGSDGADGADGSDGVDGHIKDRTDHGTVSTGTEDFDFTDSHHTITTGGSHTWTFSNVATIDPEISIKLIVSGGTPTITLPGGCTIASDSAQTLSAMAAGTYLAEIVSFDGGTSYEVLVAQVS